MFNTSLDAVVKNLKNNTNDIDQLTRSFPHTTDWVRNTYGLDALPHLTEKQQYAYDFVDCQEKLARVEPPQKADFDSKLGECGISDDDYQKFLRLWKLLKIQNLGEMAACYQVSKRACMHASACVCVCVCVCVCECMQSRVWASVLSRRK